MARTMRMTDQELAGLTTRKGAKPAAKPTARPAAKAKTATQNMQALGRLPKGQMNKTELRFEQYLLMLTISGEVLWHRFEAIKLMLAPNTSITIDFAVMMKSGELHMLDVKGSERMISEDFRAKAKIAASMFPFQFFTAIPRGRTGHEWDIKQIGQSEEL